MIKCLPKIALSPYTVLLCILVPFILTALIASLGPSSLAQAQETIIAVNTNNYELNLNHSCSEAGHMGAIITVNTASDELNNDGDCSLREAIQAANTDSVVDACPAGSGDDTLELPPGTYALATGSLDIKDNLTINGAGADNAIIDGNQLDRVLYIHDGFAVSINDTKIINGKTAHGDPVLGGPGDPGGGIYNAGRLILNNSMVSGNITGDGGVSSFGGQIGNGGNGGGIYNVGTLVLNNSSVSDNTTGSGGGGINIAGDGGAGGGIYNTGTLTVNNSTVSGNTTGDGAPPGLLFGSGGPGGGISNLGMLTLNNSIMSRNTTGNGVPGGAGGGIANGGTLSLNNSIIISNTASGSGGGLILYGSFGGNVTMVNNAIIDNHAGDTGSGVYILGGEPRLLHSTIARNSGGDGSGIYITDGLSNYSTVALTNTILVSHTNGIHVTPYNVASLDGVLWFGSGTNTDGAGTISVVNEHTGNPAFAADGYHLTTASAAIDKGLSVGVGIDIDHEPRIQGAPDLGADELVTITIRRVYLPIMCK